MAEDETPNVSDILGDPPSLSGMFADAAKLGDATSSEDTSKQVKEGVRRIQPTAVPRVRTGPFERELAQFFGMIGGAVMFANVTDGKVIIAHSDTMAAAWADLARQNAKVKMALQKLMAPGPWAGVVTATMPVVIAIAANHNMLPRQYVDVATEAEQELGANEGPGL